MPVTEYRKERRTKNWSIGDLIEFRADAIKEQRAILDAADASKRSLTPAEAREFADLDADLNAVTVDIREKEATRTSVPAFVGEEAGRGTAADGVLTRSQRVADYVATHGQRDDSEIEVTEGRSFNLGRMIRGMATGRWEGADLERRALGEGNDATGGVLVPSLLAGTVIDLARNQARVMQAGATTVMMDSDKHSIARLAAGVEGAWRKENEPVSEDAPEFERVEFKAKSLAVLVRCSVELLEDAIDGGASITDDITKALALKLDQVALRGSGTDPEPKGVRNQTGVAIESLATNGAKLANYIPLVKVAGGVRQANIEPNAFIYSARTQQSLGELVDTLGQPLRQPQAIEDINHLVTNQIPDNLKHGTSEVSSEVYTGAWNQLLIGVRPTMGVRVRMLTERYADNMQVGILASLRADVQLAHPEGFSVMTGVLA